MILLKIYLSTYRKESQKNIIKIEELLKAKEYKFLEIKKRLETVEEINIKNARTNEEKLNELTKLKNGLASKENILAEKNYLIKEKDIKLAEFKVSLESLKVTIEEDAFLIQRDEIRLLVH